jgi:hypothetical protein
MKPNMGIVDKVIRILIVVVIGTLYITHQITGAAAIGLGIIATIFLLTSIISFCPLYTLIGISSAKKRS